MSAPDVGRHEVLVLPDADHDRAAVAGGHYLVGVLEVDDGDAVGALDRPQRFTHRFGQCRRHRERDQVGQDLAVGVGAEGVPLGQQRVLDDLRVVDDPVVHDRDAAARIGVRMGVDLVRDAVGGPPGVADAHRAGKVGRRGGAQLVDLALDLVDPQAAARR